MGSVEGQLQGVLSSMGEKRQLSEVNKGTTTLHAKMTAGMINPQVEGYLHQIAGSMARGDFRTAKATHGILAKEFWGEHKDWLKGLQHGIGLGQRRLQQQAPQQQHQQHQQY